MRIIVIISLLHLAFAADCLSQSLADVPPPKGAKIGIGISGVNYLGDLSAGSDELFRVAPGAVLQIEGGGSSMLQIRLTAAFGSFSDQYDGLPSSGETSRSSFFRTQYVAGDLQLKLRFWPKKGIQPYLMAGAGILWFSPRDAEDKELRPQEDSREPGEDFNEAIPQVPIGAGIQFRLSPIIWLGVEYYHRITPTDYLDNVGKRGNRNSFDSIRGLSLILLFHFARNVY